MDQSTVSRCITRLTAAILEVYKGGFEFNGKSTRDTFLERFGLPSITGAIDCTHIEITAPPSELHPDEYINRQNNYSINVQAVCDSECVYLDVDASWPGSVHDSRIFKNSTIYQKLINGEIGRSLIGDNGYALQHICLTPFLRPSTAAEVTFNRFHKSARCVIERAFGQTKRRFYWLGCMLKVKLDKVPSIIVACFILLNLAKRFGDPDIQPDDDDDDDDDNSNDTNQIADNEKEGYLRKLGERKRQEMVDYLQRNDI